MDRRRGAALIATLALVLGLATYAVASSGDGDGAKKKAEKMTSDRVDPAAEPATECHGFKVTIFAIEDDKVYEGTPGDDIVIQAGTSSFRPNGGSDLICNFDGEDMSFSPEGDEAFVESLDSPEKMEQAIQELVDAERVTG